MKRLIALVIVCLLALALPVQAQLKKKTTPQPQKKSLTETQKKQVEAWKKINALAKEGKRDHKVFFKAFYEPVQESCADMRQKNKELAENMRAVSQKSVTEGKPQNMLKYDNYRKIYEEAIAALDGMEAAIKKGNSAETTKNVNAYLEVERKLKTQNLKLVPRQWFSMKEAETAAIGK